jgi:energy-coupling factor transporter ATP-binding protein EcfA2
MIVRQLNLANFRGFEQIELKFDEGVNVIAGVNGVGKSAILAALAVLFSRVLPEFTLSESKPLSFEDDDICLDKPSLETSAIFDVADQQCHMGIQRIRGDGVKGDLWNRFWRKQRDAKTKPMTFADMLKSRTLTGELGKAKLETDRMLRKFRELPNQPLAILFSPRRQLPGRPRALPKPKPLEISNAYGFALYDREVELREFLHWFRWQQFPRGWKVSRRKSILNKLRKVVLDFIPEFENLRLELQPQLRFVVVKKGISLSLHQLSDGERGLLAMIFDITRRLAIANPALDDPISKGQAVVLIDEIELHLHPNWQRKVLRRFTQTFKNCQFIVTTHSPQVIGQVKPASLRLLYRNREGKIARESVAQSFGMDSNWILHEIMGTPPRDYEIERKLSAIHDAIDAGDLKQARNQVKALEMSLGLFPELQEMKSMLDRFEMLKGG